ncbi:MAG TPA: sigma-70 family RNA polymerase sigma factor [Terriglobales bacterium]|nr:sigma-70 family RNA polymerase sigma factor [Terriglobales bacterium]
MQSADSENLTQLLIDVGKGNDAALNQILPQIYQELRRLAGSYMSRERSDHTLQPTALVHEAYLRLIDQRRVDWKNRAQFLGMAANMMRRVLVNHARDRAAEKRGGGAPRVTLSIAEGLEQPELDIMAVDQALEKLAELDPRKTQIVEYKFFTGLTTDEIAAVLGISVATVEREWKFARAWLFEALKAQDAAP